VLQASALDCGPAALASLLAGFGLGRPFDELREACRTGRDGTSIDALEAVAVEEGLDAEQVLVPVEHLSAPEAGCVPCILVVTQPGGAAHFVALWRIHERRAQLMDPAAGRRWPTLAELEREVYRHGAAVPAAAWHAWASSEAGLRPLASRLAALGLAAADREALLRAATAGRGWRPLAALDAAVRFVRELIAAGGIRRGRDASRLLAALYERAAEPAGRGEPAAARSAASGASWTATAWAVVPAACWTVRPVPPDPGETAGEERLLCTGAVLVRIRGLTARAAGQARPRRAGWQPLRRVPARRAGQPEGGGVAHRERPGLRAAAAATRKGDVEAPPGEPGRAARRRGRGAPSLRLEDAGEGAQLVLATAGGAVGRCAEAVLFVAALELLPAVPSQRCRLGVLGALVTLGAALLLCELTAAGSAQALGRRREIGLRLRLAEKLPRLPDRYLRTRLLADLAERAHHLAHLRRGASLFAAGLRAGIEALLAAGGIAWLDPRLGAAALAAGVAAVLVPWLLLRRCEERGRRVRAHAAALGGLYLDVLRGLGAIRAHGAETAFRRRHDELLAGWLRARRGADAAGAWLETGTQALLCSTVVAMVLAHVRREGLDARALVLVLWAFQLLVAGQRLALLAGRDLPLHRSLLRRIEEPLAATEEGEVTGATGAVEAGGAGTAEEPIQPEAEGSGEQTRAFHGTAARGPAVAAAVSGRGPRARPRRAWPGVALAWERVTVEADGHVLLRDLDLAIPAGQHVAVLGRSGAGKSTLFGTLLGWHRPATGGVLVDGRLLEAATVAELRRGTAWAAPEVALWRTSLLANLCDGMGARGPAGSSAGGAAEASAFPRAITGLAPAEALRSALLLELVSQLPQGLQTPLGEGGSRLSGGEAQRLRFARALRRCGVRLALLDEPFRGLGADQRRQLLAAARARWSGATLLCVTHSPAEAGGFERLLVLEDGGLVEDGPPANLAARRGSRYHAMLDAEARASGALLASGWRRLVLAGGQLREVPGGAAAPRGMAPAASAPAGAVLPGSGPARARPER
jgi:ABC-type bacteriocin/lantibiotic exporter with double-glycine peptidase domain